MQLSTSAVGVIAIVSVMISAMTETERGAAELGINHVSRNPEDGAPFANLSNLEDHAKNVTTQRVFYTTTSSIAVVKSSTESVTTLKRLVDNRDQLHTNIQNVKSEPNGDIRPVRHLKNDLKRDKKTKDILQSEFSSDDLSNRDVTDTNSDSLQESLFSESSVSNDSETLSAVQNISDFKVGVGRVDEPREYVTKGAQTDNENIYFSSSSAQVSTITGATSTTDDRDAQLDHRSTKSQSTKSRKSQTIRTWNELGSGKISGSIYPRKDFGDRIVQPNITSALGKYAPFFEDGDQPQNVTARIGTTVKLNCRIGMLTNKTVTWHYHGSDDIRLLTVGRLVFSLDQRINLIFQYPTNWGLRIQYASPRDSGLYECQVATFPPLIKKFYVLITAPILTIMDDSGRIVSGERHLKAGSALRLKCEVKDIHNESVLWTRGDETLTEDNISENRTTDILESREVQVVVSTLVVERATPKHAGNYSCVVPEKAKITVAVHVLNGELPAAVHDVNGVSRSVLNLWLIQLTVSYVFSR